MINFKQLLLADKDKSQEFGCLMALVNKKDCIPIINFKKKLIKEEDLYHEIDKNGKDEYGRELECHITLKFGFVRDLNELEIRQLLKEQKSFVVELYELSKFDSDPDFDVIILKAKSPILNRLNQLSSIYPNQDEHPDYQPHLTLGYVKKGLFPNLQKELNLQILIDKVSYSPIQGGKSYFTLKENTNDDIENEIQKLEKEWDRLDSIGSQSVAQHKIAEKIVALRAKKAGHFDYKSPKSQELWDKLKKSIMEEDNQKKQYQHSCVHRNDDYSNSIFSDATEMAQAVENSNPITIQKFWDNVDLFETSRLRKLIEKYPNRFDFGENENLIWAHDNNTDIHYFFV